MKKKDTYNIDLKCLLFLLFIIYFIISDIALNFFKIDNIFFKYCDEYYTLGICILILLFGFKHKIPIDKEDYKILKMILGIIILGILSNFIYKIQTSYYPIVIDAFCFSKAFICFVATKIFLSQENCNYIFRKLFLPAKIFLIVAAICGIISLFININMSGSLRYGIPSYSFIFGHEHILSVYALLSFLIIVINKSPKQNFYFILLSICEILTTKGPSIISIVILIFLFNYFKKEKKVSFKLIIIIAFICLTLGSFQIKNYLTNKNAPRYLFFKYGFITLKEHFPIGSGFATFGSDMAAKNYSSLYYDYGFYKLHGMSEYNKSFLNDTYWPMVIGQFGIVGVTLTLLILFYIYKQIFQIKDYKVKTVLFTIFLYFLIHSIGSSILTSSTGVIAFIFLGITIKSREGYSYEKVEGSN